MRDALAELLDLGALRRKPLGGVLMIELLAGQPALGILHRLLQIGDLVFERLDLRLERHGLDALTIARHPALIEVRGQASELAFLVGERALGLAQ